MKTYILRTKFNGFFAQRSYKAQSLNAAVKRFENNVGMSPQFLINSDGRGIAAALTG